MIDDRTHWDALPDPHEPDDPTGPARPWIVTDRHNAIAGGLSPDEAQRIAACLNLARGIPTAELAAGRWRATRVRGYRAIPASPDAGGGTP